MAAAGKPPPPAGASLTIQPTGRQTRFFRRADPTSRPESIGYASPATAAAARKRSGPADAAAEDLPTSVPCLPVSAARTPRRIVCLDRPPGRSLFSPASRAGSGAPRALL